MTHSDSPERPAGAARTVRISEDREGQRIDNFLLGYLKGAPRSLVYKLLRSGQVRVNGGRVKAERKLEADDQVRIAPIRLPEPGEVGTPAKGLLDGMAASIVFEDAPYGIEGAHRAGMLAVALTTGATAAELAGPHVIAGIGDYRGASATDIAARAAKQRQRMLRTGTDA
mgnify:CR=1 FL=1